MLRRLVDRRDASDELKRHAIDAIAVVERLANDRNIIVHNPWRIWVDLDNREFMTEIQKYSNPSRKLDLSLLRRFVDEATIAEINLRETLRKL